MADYYTQTVIHQHIPERLMAPFERLLLAEIFESDRHDDSFYYYASERPNDFITIDPRLLCATLAISPEKSRLRSWLKRQLAGCPAELPHLDIDLTATPHRDSAYLVILQDIVRRSQGELPYLTIAAAYTSNKMRADAFGGMGIIITPRGILYQSTYDFFQRFEARRAGKYACQSAPP